MTARKIITHIASFIFAAGIIVSLGGCYSYAPSDGTAAVISGATDGMRAAPDAMWNRSVMLIAETGRNPKGVNVILPASGENNDRAMMQQIDPSDPSQQNSPSVLFIKGTGIQVSCARLPNGYWLVWYQRLELVDTDKKGTNTYKSHENTFVLKPGVPHEFDGLVFTQKAITEQQGI
jgi:hypothetical protein